MPRFGDWLKLQLSRREMRQADLARRMGVSTGTVSDWANNRKVPDPASVDRIADALFIDVDAALSAAGHRPEVDRSRLVEIHSRLDRYLERLSDEQVEGVRRVLETLVGPINAPTSLPDPPESSPPSLSSRTDNSREGH